MVISKGQAGDIAEQLRASVTERRYRAPARTSWEVKVNIVPDQDLFFVFDDKAIRAIGAAFDQACRSLRHFAHFDRVRELVAKRIIELQKMASAIRSASIGKQSWGSASMKCRGLLIA
jgi:hypothetical protein